MAEEYEEIRTDLDNFVFIPYGKTVTFIKKTSPIYNTRGELQQVSSTNSSATIVPYNIAYKRESHQAFGNLQEGDMDAAVRYSLDVDINDGFTIDGTTYLVKQIEKNYLPENVVTIVRLSKDQ